MAVAAAIALFTISAAGDIIGGIQQKKAADAEASLQEEQGRIVAQEAGEEAQRIANDRRIFRKKQQLAFLANGVSLAGSPLLVTDLTIRESQAEVNSIARRGTAQASLAFQQAALTRTAGRTALLGGIFSAAGKLGGAAFSAAQLGSGVSAGATTTTSAKGVGIGGSTPTGGTFGGSPTGL